jgi:hypothetical protein
LAVHFGTCHGLCAARQGLPVAAGKAYIQVTDYFWKPPLHNYFIRDQYGKIKRLQFQGTGPPPTFRAGGYFTVDGVQSAGLSEPINVTSLQVSALLGAVGPIGCAADGPAAGATV